jgi:hypothetical protein
MRSGFKGAGPGMSRRSANGHKGLDGLDLQAQQAAEKLCLGIILEASSNDADGVKVAGCSKWPFSKAAASEEARRTLGYVEPLSDARTPLADVFSILLVSRS